MKLYGNLLRKLVFLWLVFPVSGVFSQINLQTTFGGPANDQANCIVKTPDGGYLIGGISASFGAGGDDIMVVRTGPAGNQLWAKTYGGAGAEYLRAIRLTQDGGFVLAGHTQSFGNGDEALFMKINALGNVQWSITLGQPGLDRGCDIVEFPWGDFAICGSTSGYGPVATGDKNFVGRLSPTGTLRWARAFGGGSGQSLFGLNIAPDNTIVATGPTSSYGAGSFDYQLTKFDTSGTQLWYRTLGTTANEHSRTVQNVPGGGFLVFGHSNPGVAGNFDNLVVRTDGFGNVVWARAYGGANLDYAMGSTLKSTGGFAFSSSTQSGSLGGYDVLVTQCDSLGSVQWRKVFGGPLDDEAPWGGKNIVEVTPGKYAMAAGTNSFGPGGGDYYLLVVDSTSPNPCNVGTIPLATGPRIVLTSTFSPPSANIPVITPRVLTVTTPVPASVIQCRDSLSGIINIYTPVTSIDSCGSISVVSTAGFSVGDKVLIIQMKGADIDLTNTPSFGNINSYNQAGNYEFCTISGIAGTSISFQNSLLRFYDPAGLVQLVSVPQLSNPFIISTLTASPWNGTTGGILTFEASGTVTLGADLDVSGLGFRGGAKSLDFYSGCSSTGYFFAQPSTMGAQKGEGVSDPGLAFGAGQGPLANGGGGGQHINAGGAGGGNGGPGGEGGYQWIGSTGGCPYLPLGGDPGRVLTYNSTINKIFLGGGGGGGHQNNSNSTPGVAGGGLIIARANSFEGNGFSLFARGLSQSIAATNDGAGGGGAGGAIILEVGTYSSPLNLNVAGGNGGNCQIEHGPGGGGGGGAILLSNAVVPGAVIPFVLGGNPGSNTFNSHGALAGGNGVIINNVLIPESTLPSAPPLFSLGNDTIICQGDSVVLNPGLPSGISYFWSTGDTTSTITVTTSGSVWLEVSNGASCISRDTILITVAPVPAPNLGPDLLLCQGDSVTLDPGVVVPANYVWSNGSTADTLRTPGTGLIWVEATDLTGTCAGRDSVVVNTAPNPVVNLGPDLAICGTTPTVLDAGNPGATYAWSNAATSQTITVSTTGTYSVTVTTAAGCSRADTVNITYSPNPIVNLGPDQQICAGQTVLLDAGNPGSTYAWNPSISTQQQAVVNATGTFSVTVTTAAGCTGTDAVNVTVFPTPVVNLGPDLSRCRGETAVLDAGNPGSSYAWNNGGTGQTITVANSGNYSVTVTTANGCTSSDVVNVIFHPNPNVNLGIDRTICEGTITTISANNNGSSYQWSTGQTSQIIQVSATGSYWVEVTTPFGCTGRDTIDVNVIPLPIVDLGPDQLLCLGDSLSFDAGNPGNAYSWNTGETTQTISVFSGGTYSVTVTNADGCRSNDRVVITERGPFAFTLGPDTILCEQPPFRIGMNVQYGQYLWQDGTTTAIYAVKEDGIYSITVNNGCFSVEDSIQVSFLHRGGPFAPNAFTPNGDGLNDVFGFVGENIEDFELAIFDRWGKLIFITQNPNDKWDGMIDGTQGPEGVYAYRVRFRDCRDILTDRGGSITLLR